MSKDLLVLADEYAAATATFARALALKDEADSMSPIAREAGDKRAVLAEALAALDTAQQEPVNALLVEALERMVESVTGVDQVSAVNEAREALERMVESVTGVDQVSAVNEAREASQQPSQAPQGCACRWDAEDNRIATCTRHQGWLDVVQEWADRAKDAEAKLAQPSQADAQDAARYRWIRLGKPYRVVVDAPTKKKPDAKITIMVSPSPESDYARALDAAIDAAINAKEKS